MVQFLLTHMVVIDVNNNDLILFEYFLYYVVVVVRLKRNIHVVGT